MSVDRNRLALTRFANSVIHQNVAEDTTTACASASTATAARRRLGDGHRRGRACRPWSSARVAAVRSAPLDPGWPGLAPPRRPAPVAPPDPATARRHAGRPGRRVVRAFVDGAGGLETAGYCRTNHWTGAFANSAGQAVAGEAASAACPASPAATAPTASPATRRSAGRPRRRCARRPRRGQGPRRRPTRSSCRRAATRSCSSRPRSPTSSRAFASSGFNGKAVNERRSFVRLGEAQFDPAITLVDDPLGRRRRRFDAEGTPRQRLVARRRGTTVALTHDRRTAAEAGAESTGHAVEVGVLVGAVGPPPRAARPSGRRGRRRRRGRRAGRRRVRRRARRRRRARHARVRPLVHPDARPAHAGDHRADPQRRVADRGRRGHHAAAQLPLHPVVRPGADAGQRARRRRVADAVPGDTYTATAPRWTCPALHLASWNFTGGASG